MKKKEKLHRAVKKLGGVIIDSNDDGFACQLPRSTRPPMRYALNIIVSWGGGWDHVSIHGQTPNVKFTPFWEDMCFVKNVFFKLSETAYQFHPARNNHINIHKNVLHIWRKQGQEIEMPPIEMV